MSIIIDYEHKYSAKILNFGTENCHIRNKLRMCLKVGFKRRVKRVTLNANKVFFRRKFSVVPLIVTSHNYVALMWFSDSGILDRATKYPWPGSN